MSAPPADFDAWEAPLARLCERIRAATAGALARARAGGDEAALARPARSGAGDVTFGLDVPSEREADRFLEERARHGPLSVLSEEAGWRHAGPEGELAGFDHGGPRIALDPIDGTRNLMAGLRSAWTAVAFAGPGAGPPRLSDVQGAIVSELPTRLAARYRVLVARRGAGAALEERAVETGAPLKRRALAADADDRVDQAYLPVFRYTPEQRPAIARIEAALCAALAAREGADPRAIYDDQYISNAGQLVLLALGAYRAVFDPRAHVAARLGRRAVTAKPYDVAAAILVAREAGAPVAAVDGGALDFELDATTPVSFAGYANPATRARVEPCWRLALEAGLGD